MDAANRVSATNPDIKPTFPDGTPIAFQQNGDRWAKAQGLWIDF
jgi:hypothetical protein